MARRGACSRRRVSIRRCTRTGGRASPERYARNPHLTSVAMGANGHPARDVLAVPGWLLHPDPVKSAAILVGLLAGWGPVRRGAGLWHSGPFTVIGSALVIRRHDHAGGHRPAVDLTDPDGG